MGILDSVVTTPCSAQAIQHGGNKGCVLPSASQRYNQDRHGIDKVWCNKLELSSAAAMMGAIEILQVQLHFKESS